MLFFLSPDYNQGSAGVRKLYLDTQVLVSHGIEAVIVHEARGFRCTWFPSSVSVIARDQVRAEGRDVIVIPEIYGSTISRLYPGTNKVIYNQNWANTFVGGSSGSDASPYLNPEILAVLCASERDRAFLAYAFPDLPRDRIFPVCYSVDPDLFFYSSEEKRDQIAYMTHKNLGHLEQVLCLLRSRGALRGWNVVPIENASYAETARVLRESKIFLSGSFPEGFSLVAAEAVACGCAVVGYFSREYFGDNPAMVSVPVGRILEFAQSVEDVMRDMPFSSEALRFYGDHVRRYYSPEREAERTLSIWREILPQAVEMLVRPRYSIIVPCWNNAELTVNCLRSVAQYSDCYEIIAIDNGSTDGTATVLERMAAEGLPLRAIRNAENLGWTRAINQGSQVASGDFLVWLNNDTTVSEGWLHQLAGHLEPGTGAVGPVSPNGGWRQNAALSGPISETARFLTGFCLMIPREVWLRVGGLDESFTQGADDLDYSLRLQRAGYRLAIARDVVIEHVGGASFQNLESCRGSFGSEAYARFMREGLVAFTNKWGPEWLNYLMGRDFLPPRD